ncbi:MAG: type II toxin-antitoxin system HicA family toxin [bacterium]|jgi:predicted RNA binding protein YcfA (HicA-like mRNA interferase family)
MPHFGPTKRRDLVRRLKELGFSGPYTGGKHQFMQRGDVTLLLPNPHEADISVELLSRVLRQAGVSRADWERD